MLSNPLSTNDDVAAALVPVDGVATFARLGETPAVYESHLDAVLDHRPALTIDDGCDLVARLHLERPQQATEVLGGTEDTTTGALRLRAIAASGSLRYPVVAVSGAETRRLADNRYGTGQSTMDGIMRATNVLIAGTTVVVAGYGNCGRGIAERARGLGAIVIVTETDPLRALEAVLDGYRVMPMSKAVREGRVFLTATGNRDVIRREHFADMGDGAILANAGNFDAEIDVGRLGRHGERLEAPGAPDGRRVRHHRSRRRATPAASSRRGPARQPGGSRGSPARSDGPVLRRAGAGRASGSSVTTPTWSRSSTTSPRRSIRL